jgi:FtsP/CotA-like multicopper oxidase with cupredoxin domain
MKSMSILKSLPGVFRAGLAALLLGTVGQAQAYINGWEGTGAGTPTDPRTFVLTAKQDFVSTSDGGSHYAWGYSYGTDLPMQYPGPTLIVKQGETVKIVLNNTLPVPVSITFPGLQGVTATGGLPGMLTREARAVPASEKAVVAGPTYTFVADKPGTYLYNSGTQPDLQVEMGLIGALIVRPNGYAVGSASSHASRKAYEQPGTQYDRENLFLLSEMDPAIHWAVYSQVFSNKTVIAVDTSTIKPSLWFINGRNAPDTLLEDHVDWLPTQPYNALPRMHAGERLLMRVVSAGRDLHPFHHHGNHATPIARDARVLESAPGVGPDVTSPDFTVRAIPGQTMDLIFEWTGQGIGWDVYGTADVNPHQCNGSSTPSQTFDPVTKEWCGDHYKPIPVTLAGPLDVSYGESWGGGPFLGLVGALPQGHPGLNTTGGYYHMWHSHNEKEITTDDIFPGGMMTMLIVEPRSVDLFEDLP